MQLDTSTSVLDLFCIEIMLHNFFPSVLEFRGARPVILTVLAVLVISGVIYRFLYWHSTTKCENDPFEPCTPRGKCRICYYDLPLDGAALTCMPCCGKIVCTACIFKSMDEYTDRGKPLSCFNCRCTIGDTAAARVALLHDRIQIHEKRNSHAFFILGQLSEVGRDGLRMDLRRALTYYRQAAELGHAPAYFKLAVFYSIGSDEAGVDRDEEKSHHFFSLAAKGGYVHARYCLGVLEFRNGNNALAYRHWRLSAAVGCDRSLDCVVAGFRRGSVTKQDYFAALRDHFLAKGKMISEAREQLIAELPQKDAAAEQARYARATSI